MGPIFFSKLKKLSYMSSMFRNVEIHFYFLGWHLSRCSFLDLILHNQCTLFIFYTYTYRCIHTPTHINVIYEYKIWTKNLVVTFHRWDFLKKNTKLSWERDRGQVLSIDNNFRTDESFNKHTHKVCILHYFIFHMKIFFFMSRFIHFSSFSYTFLLSFIFLTFFPYL